MRQRIYNPHFPNFQRSRTLLLKNVCAFRESNTQTRSATSAMLYLWGDIRQTSFRSQEKQREQAFLFPRLLVCLQSARQSLSLGRWAKRTNESRCFEVAQGCAQERQTALSIMPCDETLRGPSYSSFSQSHSRTLASLQWDYTLPRLSCTVRQMRDEILRSASDEILRNTSIFGSYPFGGVACS